MRKIGQAIGYLLAIAVMSWMPVGIVFVFMGIWGDRRWLVTGLVMIGVAVLTMLTALICKRISDNKFDPDKIDWSDHDR